MRKKLKVTLAVFFIIAFASYSEAFAESRISVEAQRNSKSAADQQDTGKKDNINDGSEIGIKNFNGTSENSAKLGCMLTNPEIGWRRYDDSSSLIQYIGNWALKNDETQDVDNDYSHTLHRSLSLMGEAKFYFKGTKLRILAYNGTGRSSNVKVTIDGKDYSLDESRANQSSTLSFEVLGLDKGNHEVTIGRTEGDGGRINIDAIDIDSDGAMLKMADDLTLNKATDTLSVGDTDQLVPIVTPDDAANKSILWQSSNPDVVTVDENGNLTAVKEGKAEVIASTNDGSGLVEQCEVSVSASDLQDDMILSKSTDTLSLGDTDQLTVNSNSKSITWESSNPDVAKVDNNGKVTAVKCGGAFIIARQGKVAKVCVVSVTNVGNLALNKTTDTLNVGDTDVLTVENNKSVIWRTTDPSIVKVDDNGKIVAVSTGTASILVQSNEGILALCTVTVK